MEEQPLIYRVRAIKLLGGEAFLTGSDHDLPLSGSVTLDFWRKAYAAMRLASRMTPRSERKNDGTFPSILIRSVNLCLKRRREASKHFSEKLVQMNFKNAVEVMQSWAVEDANDSELLFTSASESEDDSDSGSLSKHKRQRLLVARTVSELWGNTSWKRQKSRSDLAPIILTSAGQTTASLWQMTSLTSISASNPPPNGFPPLVLKALKQSVSIQESLGNAVKAPLSGWIQKKVVPNALPILQDLIKSEATNQPPPLSISQSPIPAQQQKASSPAPPPPSSVPNSNSSTIQEPSTKSFLKALRRSLDHALSNPNIKKARKKQLKGHYRSVEKFLKKRVVVES